MKVSVKKLSLGAAVLAASLYLSSPVQALGITETGRYGRTPSPFSLQTVYSNEVKNVDLAGNVIPTEGTDFSQYYWRGDRSAVRYDYDGRTTYMIYYTVRSWEAK